MFEGEELNNKNDFAVEDDPNQKLTLGDIFESIGNTQSQGKVKG